MRGLGLCVRQYLTLLYDDMSKFELSAPISWCWSIYACLIAKCGRCGSGRVWAHVPIVGEVVGQRTLRPRAEERTFLA